MIYFFSLLIGYIFVLLVYRIIRYRLTKYNRENVGLSVIVSLQIIVMHREYLHSLIIFGFLVVVALIFLILFIYGLVHTKEPHPL